MPSRLYLLFLSISFFNPHSPFQAYLNRSAFWYLDVNCHYNWKHESNMSIVIVIVSTDSAISPQHWRLTLSFPEQPWVPRMRMLATYGGSLTQFLEHMGNYGAFDFYGWITRTQLLGQIMPGELPQTHLVKYPCKGFWWFQQTDGHSSHHFSVNNRNHFMRL